MTHQLDVAHSRDIVARWCTLAEQRLDHLTELFETGRWRRYHSERAFLENLQEAKAAVETWRNLSTREASLDNSAIDMSWLGRIAATLQSERFRDKLVRPQPLPEKVQAEPPPTVISIVPKADPVRAAETPPRGEGLRDQVCLPQPQPAKIAAELSPAVASIVPITDLVRAAEAISPPVVDDDVPEPGLTPIVERYPQLRNAL